MAVRDNLYHFAGNLAFNLTAGGKSPAQWAQRLADNGRKLETTFAATPQTEFNARVLNHIIGIERWGQRRLRVALGEPFVRDEYNGYRPAREASWDELKRDFVTTRADTVRIARELEQAKAGDKRILHNAYGNLTVRGWLRYLDIHSSFEAKKMR